MLPPRPQTSKGYTRITLCSVIFVHGLFGDRQQTWTRKIGRHEKTLAPNLDTSSQPQKNHPTLLRKLFSKVQGVILSDSGTSFGEGPASKGLQKPASSPSEVFWPRDLLPGRFLNFRIFTWGYDVDIDHPSATVFQHAANLLSDLCDVRTPSEAESRPLFFVAHSLGGIVVKDVNTPLRVHRHQPLFLFRATYSLLPFVQLLPQSTLSPLLFFKQERP